MQEYTIVIKEALSKGLRSSPHFGRNEPWLFQALGCIPEDGVLQSLSEPPQALSLAGEVWPFPQVVRLRDFLLVCGATRIYTYDGTTLTNVYSGALAGWTWSFADFGQYVLATNGKALVFRDPASGVWQEYILCAIPTCLCLCEFNGQIVMGGPGETVLSGETGELL